jgi:hypothetical protein
MAKATFTIRMDGEVWERFQEVFPNQASPMIEDFMKDMLSVNIQGSTSREELLKQGNKLFEERKRIEAQEKALQLQLKSFEEISEEKKQLLESEEAQEKRKQYDRLPEKLRLACADVCAEISSLKLKQYLPLYPFRFYFSVLLDEEEKEKLFQIADKNNYFQLKGFLLQFNKLFHKHVEDTE